MKLKNEVKFWGFVSTEKKKELMSRAHVIVVPSLREGWGLIVTEANAVGTAALVFDSPGLRDSVKSGITGLVTEYNTPECLAWNLEVLHSSPKLLKKLSENAHRWSFSFNWDNTGQVAKKWLQEYVR